MEIKHQGNANAAGMDRLAEEFPQRKYQELIGNFIVVPEISKEENEKLIDIAESKVIVPVEGSLKQDEWDVLEPQKKVSIHTIISNQSIQFPYFWLPIQVLPLGR